MPVKCSIYIGASVDGFIAGPDGDIEWMERPEYSTPEAGDYGYQAFASTVDALVMGRHTYEKMLTFTTWSYGEMPIVVLSSTTPDVPPALRQRILLEQGEPRQVVERLAARGFQHLYIDGGVTIQRFLHAGLIDEMTITHLPVLLGRGIPLFGATGRELQLRHLGTETFANGFVQTRYQVINPERPALD